MQAQEARRVLDRLVGYVVSPLLWKKVAPKLSAGRVQSVAVRMLVLRERERMAFNSGEYWDLKAELEASGTRFNAQLVELDGTPVAQGRDFDEKTGELSGSREVTLLDGASANALRDALERAFTVGDEKCQSKRSPYPPFTTSTLQRGEPEARAERAPDDGCAEALRERPSPTSYRQRAPLERGHRRGARARRAALRQRLSEKERRYSTKSKGAQEAHEAIRPAGTEMPTAKELGLGGMDARLYELIWMRTVASQMAEARIAFTTAKIDATTEDGRVGRFRASGRVVEFAGFLRAYVEGRDNPEEALDDSSTPLPALTTEQVVNCSALEALGHETKPPARFTEASLVKALEKEGIGRPSTYASIIDTIQRRGYVMNRSKQLVPTFTAMAVTNLLERTHTNVVDLEFTAGMESQLDGIADGEDAQHFLQSFYETNLLRGLEQSDELHPRGLHRALRGARGHAFDIRVGRYGPYVEVPQEDAEKPSTVSLPAETAPADVTPEMVAELIKAKEIGDEPLGTDPETGLPIFALTGRYGPYVQLGEMPKKEKGKKVEQADKPKRASLPKGMTADQVTLEKAISLLSLPRHVGHGGRRSSPVSLRALREAPAHLREPRGHRRRPDRGHRARARAHRGQGGEGARRQQDGPGRGRRAP